MMQVMWPKMMENKWLRLKSGGHKFKSDAEDEAADDHFFNGVPPLSDKSAKRCPALLRGQSETLRMECVDNYNYRMFVGTWNVGGRRLQNTSDLEDWLNKKESCDIFVIGLQKIVPLKDGKVLSTENSRATNEWDSPIRGMLNKSLAPKNTFISKSASILLSSVGESGDRQWTLKDDDNVDNFKFVDRASVQIRRTCV